jgi:hypothetical protein
LRLVCSEGHSHLNPADLRGHRAIGSCDHGGDRGGVCCASARTTENGRETRGQRRRGRTSRLQSRQQRGSVAILSYSPTDGLPHGAQLHDRNPMGGATGRAARGESGCASHKATTGPGNRIGALEPGGPPRPAGVRSGFVDRCTFPRLCSPWKGAMFRIIISQLQHRYRRDGGSRQCAGGRLPSAIMRATPTHGLQVWPHPARPVRTARAKVAELADALDLESSGETRESSSLSFRTSSPWLH